MDSLLDDARPLFGFVLSVFRMIALSHSSSERHFVCIAAAPIQRSSVST